MVVLQELDSLQDLVAPSAQSGQLADKDSVYAVFYGIGQGFLKHWPILICLAAGNMLFKCFLNYNGVSVGIGLEIFNLSGRVLSAFKGS